MNYNYIYQSDYSFFEEKRFDENNLPTFKDIDFLFKEKEFKDLKNNIEDENIKIPVNLWNKIKAIFEYKTTNKEIKTLRKEAIANEPLFKEYLDKKIIRGFDEMIVNGKTIMESLKDINICSYSNMYEYFQKGNHIGNCGFTSRFLGIMFDEPIFHRGRSKLMLNTKNATDGNHAWIETYIEGKKYIIDTSLLCVIPIELKEKLGYVDLKRENTVKEYVDFSDEYFEHYEILSKITTKNKLSYDSYRKNLEKLRENKEREINE